MLKAEIAMVKEMIDEAVAASERKLRAEFAENQKPETTAKKITTSKGKK